MGDPENLGIAVGTACLSAVEREIKVLPVWRPSFCTSGVGLCRDLIDYVPYIWAGKIPFEIVGISDISSGGRDMCDISSALY